MLKEGATMNLVRVVKEYKMMCVALQLIIREDARTTKVSQITSVKF